MSIDTCAKCDRYVDTDNAAMVTINGDEYCEPCADDIEEETEALADVVEDTITELTNNHDT